MTTRLEGEKTYFLPFNQGSNGAGRVGGKGNPVNESGYDTAYLWQNVLCKERLLEILNKYLSLCPNIFNVFSFGVAVKAKNDILSCTPYAASSSNNISSSSLQFCS